MLKRLFILYFLVQNLNGFAQTLAGNITDEYASPIYGALVVNLTNQDHAHSDDDGAFLLDNIKIGDSLYVSHFSYEVKLLVIEALDMPIHVGLKVKSISLNEIVISPDIDALNLFTDIDLQTNPVNSSQDILRSVPGLFIGQHAGGGKAEQIFLRGFDIDHGTDIAIAVDGIPVNMVSHAHGQGYADLHFVIPETVDKIGFGKGPYYANKGNFNTAGYVDFQTKKSLDYSSLKLESGMFNTNRLLGMFNLLNTEKQSSYVAMEYLATDGPFESPQNFNRINLLAKYDGNISGTAKAGILVSYFTSEWDASGQIPQRAVDSGMISRFGAIDDTEGGNTSRTNILFHYDKTIDKNSILKNSFFYSKYDFELYSNFTYFLDDPINGDQIKQKENRNIFGLNSDFYRSFSSGAIDGNWQAGISIRFDESIDNELSHTVNRNQTLDQIQLGDIAETNYGGYLSGSFNINKWTFNPEIRIDLFDFQYNDALQTNYETQANTKTIVSPKFNILYHSSPYLQLYLKSGKGFHSNDTRDVIAQDGSNILPAAYGFDIGVIHKPLPRLLINAAYWYLFLEQEFVYVGDAGIIEPSGKTQRQGIDLSIRYQTFNWIFLSLDANYTLARATEEAVGEDYIPLAPDFTLVGGLNITHPSGAFGGINLRYIKDRPANEDNSVIAKGYAVIDANIGYKWKKLSFGIQVQNLLNTEWNETQFATESRLQNEDASITEIHFTPGTPFFIKGVVEYKF